MSENMKPAATGNIPSSPLKEDHLLSSPNFRPAGEQNLTVELRKTGAGGRKSLGRRVSFAATAHVRLYEKGDSDREAGSGSEDERDLDFRPLPRKSLPLLSKGSPMPPPAAALHSPLRPSQSRLHESVSAASAAVDLDLESSLPSTPSAMRSGRSSLKPGESPSLLPRPVRFSTVTNYSEGEASFDVEIKDVNSSSFTSYHSGGEEDATMELGPHLPPRTDDTDMDFTGCVGGILASGKPPPTGGSGAEPLVPAAAAAATEDETMDFTVCVGGLIRRLPSVRLSDVSAVSSVDTMELTESVGQILSRQKQQQHQMADMELTAVLPSAIQQQQLHGSAERLGSPSPFLVATPPRPQEPPAGLALMTFIGDVGEPDAFRLLESMSPMVSSSTETPEAAQERRLFDSLIDTAKCSEEPTPIKHLPAQSLPPSIQGSLSVMATPRRPVLSYSAQPSSYSQLASPAHSTVSTPPTAAVPLADFLNETGVRFLENISSLKRRETTGRPRDSDIVVPARQAFVAAALVPQLDFFEQASEDLVPRIVETREILAQQESQFAVQPPLALLQWQRACNDVVGRQTVLARLKTLKSVARLMAKQHWHAWRLPRQLALVAAMEEAAARAGAAWDPLQRADRHLDALLSQLEPQERSLKAELNAVLHARAFPDAAEQARQLEATVAAQAEAIAAADAELAAMEQREAELCAAVAAAAAQKEALAQRIESARTALAATPRATELALAEMRSLLALRKAVSGWEFVHVGPASLSVRYLLGGPVSLRFDFDPATRIVNAVQIAAGSPRLAILRHAPRIAPRTGVPLAESLADALGRLDAIAQIERIMTDIDPSCTFVVEEPADSEAPLIPFHLGFFHYEARSKFDIGLAVDASGQALRLVPTHFAHHYGPVTEADVHDYIGMALSNPAIERAPAACKQILASVLGLMAEHTVDGRPSDAFSLCLHQTDMMQTDD